MDITSLPDLFLTDDCSFSAVAVCDYKQQLQETSSTLRKIFFIHRGTFFLPLKLPKNGRVYGHLRRAEGFSACVFDRTFSVFLCCSHEPDAVSRVNKLSSPRQFACDGSPHFRETCETLPCRFRGSQREAVPARSQTVGDTSGVQSTDAFVIRTRPKVARLWPVCSARAFLIHLYVVFTRPKPESD